MKKCIRCGHDAIIGRNVKYNSVKVFCPNCGINTRFYVYGKLTGIGYLEAVKLAKADWNRDYNV